MLTGGDFYFNYGQVDCIMLDYMVTFLSVDSCIRSIILNVQMDIESVNVKR